MSEVIILFRKIRNKLLMYLLKSKFKSIGKNVIFDPNDFFSYQTISIGNDVFIGSGAKFSASYGNSISIGNKVMFGPNVSIMAGNHRIDVIGKYMFDVKEKLPENDLPVVIEEDVWIGTGAIITKGVTISKGSVVAAGAVVNKSFPPYSILGGIPARILKVRFNDAEIIEHERKLYKNGKEIIS